MNSTAEKIGRFIAILIVLAIIGYGIYFCIQNDITFADILGWIVNAVGTYLSYAFLIIIGLVILAPFLPAILAFIVIGIGTLIGFFLLMWIFSFQ